MAAFIGEVRRRHVEKTLAELIDRRDIVEARVSRLEKYKRDLWDALSELQKVNTAIAGLRRELRSGL